MDTTKKSRDATSVNAVSNDLDTVRARSFEIFQDIEKQIVVFIQGSDAMQSARSDRSNVGPFCCLAGINPLRAEYELTRTLCMT